MSDKAAPTVPDFDIDDAASRLSAKNSFDGNLRHGAGTFHKVTNRSGEGKPSSGKMSREQAMVVDDTGVDRYRRRPGIWEDVLACPVCGGTDVDFMLARFGQDIMRCRVCTHRYSTPRVTFDTAVSLYRDDKTASDIYTQPMQVEIDEIKYQYGLDLVEKLGPPGRDKIMDVGCGSGVYLRVAEANGWGQCVGVDINERYADVYAESPGVQFINSSFEDLDVARIGKDYDVIAMWSVLEHIYNVHDILDKLHAILKPGGLLFILVPNVESLATRLMRERSPTFSWKHLAHFSPKSLTHLIEAHGFDKIFHETVITEIDNIKSYMSGEYPYHGHGDPDHLFDFITPEYIHQHMLGSRQIAVFRRS